VTNLEVVLAQSLDVARLLVILVKGFDVTRR